MNLAETVQLRRAEEQVCGVRLTGYWERDSWDVPRNAIRPERKTARNRCLAGDCPKRGTHHGYCRKHYGRVVNGMPVDGEDLRFGSIKSRREGR